MDATYPSTRGEIFNAFSANQRVGIWDRLQLIDCLIPYLHTLFKDINYLQVLVHCLKWLISISLNNTISMALKRAFLKKGSSTPNLIDQCDFGIRELYGYAMRHFFDIPGEANTKNAMAKPTVTVNRMVLWEVAKFASQLGEFKSPKITKLRKHLHSTAATQSPSSKHLLVENDPGEPKKKRCGLPGRDAYAKDSMFLYLCNIHKK